MLRFVAVKALNLSKHFNLLLTAVKALNLSKHFNLLLTLQ